MPVNQEAGTSRVFVVINARSGNASPDLVRKALESQGAEGAIDLQIAEPPREGGGIGATVRQAVANGFETVVAAGGSADPLGRRQRHGRHCLTALSITHIFSAPLPRLLT